jgi:hypothetical protein
MMIVAKSPFYSSLQIGLPVGESSAIRKMIA